MLASALETKRLELHPATLDAATADLEDRARFAHVLGAEVPASWPPELYDLDAQRWVVRAIEGDPHGFLTYYFLAKRDPERPLLIGIGGFKGRLQDGSAEIGYSIVPDWRGQGLGTEAVRALTRRAFEHLGANTVCAHTLTTLLPSQRVLEKNGFVLRGTSAEEGAIRYEISRMEWNREQHYGKLG